MMEAIIGAVAAAIVCTISCTLLSRCFLTNESNNGFLILIKQSAIFGVVAAALAAIYIFAFSSLFNCETLPSSLSVAVITILSYFAFIGRKFINSEKVGRLLFRLGVLSLIALALESFVFNFKSLTTGNDKISPSFSQAYTETPQTVQTNSDSITFSGDGSVIIPIDAEDVGAVSFKFSGTDEWIRCMLSIKDGNFQDTYINAGEKFVSSAEGADFAIHPYESLNEIKVTLSEVDSAVIITDCTFSKALPFNFSDLRFLLTLLIMGLICVIVSFKLYNKRYDNNNLKHQICVCALVVLCVLMTMFMYDPNQSMIDYNTADIANSDPFVQMFDATINGRVSLDITPSAELLSMENPYDSSLRTAQNVSFAWDRAFYDGEYYSYYGITPVLIFYFPVYFLTGMLPTLNMTSVFFAGLSIIFICGAILAFVKRYLKKVNLLMLLALMAGTCFASGTYFLAASSSLYVVPGLAGSCFLFLCVWTGISAIGQEVAWKRYLLFTISGLSLALCVAARPTRALSALIIIFAFIGVLLDKKLSFKRKFASAASFVIPLALGGICIMIYNYLRFDSPFDFGAAYQLTVSDVSANKLYLTSLPYALVQYFFQPLQMTNIFPYIGFTNTSLAGNGMYIYTGDSHGALVYPLIFAGVAVLPFLLYHISKNKEYKLRQVGYTLAVEKKYTYILALLISVIVAWLDYCMAGVIFSYICDILPVLCLLSVWVLLDAERQFTSSTAAAKYTCACTIISSATIVLVLMELLTLYSNGLYKTMPNIMFVAEELLCFWN